ncbi:MAG TPA: amidohydrolase family protein, partial [Lachnospiraceae bacterium]|nr:amidohydrolase family protein [Lachnospiraceae bacterium]
MIITNGTVFTDTCTFEKRDIELKGSTILDIKETSQSETQPAAFPNSDSFSNEVQLDATDCYVIPGLIDIHFHGCVGYDFCDGTIEAMEKIAAYELSSGTTSICPATMTLPVETLESICQTASQYVSSGASPLVGINLEGPFISEIKKGAQNKNYIIKPNIELLKQLQKDSSGLVKLVAIAPEEEGAIDLISALKSEFVFSIAHTNANYQIAMDAFHAGASHVTHLYNAMLPFTHREPG